MCATYFVYDGDNPVEEVGANRAVLAMNGFGADGLRFRTSGPGEAGTYYTYDPQGNLAQRLSLPGSGYGGTIEVPNFWSAFGIHSLAPGTAILPGEDQVGFGGQYGYYQDPTGLYLLGSRYYAPNLGRFLTRDTIGYQGGPNLYAYCGNNPITREDPAGTDDADEIFPESQSGGADVVGPLTNKEHELSADGKQVGQMAMDANPIGATAEAATGTNASGAKISGGERAWDAVTAFGGAALEGAGALIGDGTKYAAETLNVSKDYRATFFAANRGLDRASVVVLQEFAEQIDNAFGGNYMGKY